MLPSLTGKKDAKRQEKLQEPLISGLLASAPAPEAVAGDLGVGAGGGGAALWTEARKDVWGGEEQG